MVKKRKAAKQLFLLQGVTQKEAAEIVGASEKTVGLWAKKYKWKADKKKQDEHFVNLYDFVSGFKEDVMLLAPRYYERICLLVDEYVSRQETM